MRKKFYLAYGSNLNIEQMARRCPGAKVAGIATLHDWRLLFRGSKTGAYLTVQACPGASVPVGVWEITPQDERALDRYEGFPVFYRKRPICVTMYDIVTGHPSEIEAMIYIMREDRPLGIPSQEYLSVCGDGYLDFGFDFEPLEDALACVRRELSAG